MSRCLEVGTVVKPPLLKRVWKDSLPLLKQIAQQGCLPKTLAILSVPSQSGHECNLGTNLALVGYYAERWRRRLGVSRRWLNRAPIWYRNQSSADHQVLAVINSARGQGDGSGMLRSHFVFGWYGAGPPTHRALLSAFVEYSQDYDIQGNSCYGSEHAFICGRFDEGELMVLINTIALILKRTPFNQALRVGNTDVDLAATSYHDRGLLFFNLSAEPQGGLDPYTFTVDRG